jgi:hypothetical protein
MQTIAYGFRASSVPWSTGAADTGFKPEAD